MDLKLTEPQRRIIMNVRRFVREEIEPLERDLDPDAYELPPAEAHRLTEMVKAMGLYQMGVPQEYGGPSVDIITRTLVAEEMSQHRAGLYAPAYGVFGSNPPEQLYAANEQQKERYLWPVIRGEKHSFFGLTEPSGGSDPARAIQTKGVRDGDDWIINGSKMFNSGADTADFGLVFVRTNPQTGRQGITCFLVDTDTPGFIVKRLVHVLRAHYTTELAFDDMRVPQTNILGEEGKGFAIANEQLSMNRIPYAAAGIGVAVAAQRMAIDYAKGRQTFGDFLANRQAIQWMIVDNELDIRTSRWLTLDAASKAHDNKPFRFEAAAAKVFATEAAGRVVDRSIQIHGGVGVTKDMPLERWYRELRIRRIGEGPSEVQRIIMARDLLSGAAHSEIDVQ
ncbi:MAG TPA: acyl-CoA dehydrogenase family protein [Dehalococcoidia bacterium]|nr:acyl-CoA dehydrogenase family protein [Dehalococcoidia bacterium]